MSAPKDWVAGVDGPGCLERWSSLDWDEAAAELLMRVRLEQGVATAEDQQDFARLVDAIAAAMAGAPDGATIDVTIGGVRFFVMDRDEFVRDDERRQEWAAQEALAEFEDALALSDLGRFLEQMGREIGFNNDGMEL